MLTVLLRIEECITGEDSTPSTPPEQQAGACFQGLNDEENGFPKDAQPWV